MTTKVCSKCKVEKDLGEFNNKKAAADGKAAYCTACNKAALVKWRSENPEKVRESSAKWRAENPEKARERRKVAFLKWKANNPESFKRIRRNQANKQVARCSNSYVKAALKLPNPPQELIELKREHLQMHRVTQCLLKTLKDEDNE